MMTCSGLGHAYGQHEHTRSSYNGGGKQKHANTDGDMCVLTPVSVEVSSRCHVQLLVRHVSKIALPHHAVTLCPLRLVSVEWFKMWP